MARPAIHHKGSANTDQPNKPRVTTPVYLENVPGCLLEYTETGICSTPPGRLRKPIKLLARIAACVRGLEAGPCMEVTEEFEIGEGPKSMKLPGPQAISINAAESKAVQAATPA